VVCSVPAVPWSAAYCQECLDANAHPYHIIVSNTWALGGYDNSVDWWQAIVNDTLTHLEIPMEQFIEDVEADEF
jgi:hypothetical protein